LIHPSKTAGIIEIWQSADCLFPDCLFVKREVTIRSTSVIDIPCQGNLDGKISGEWLCVPDLARHLEHGMINISGEYGSGWTYFNKYMFRSIAEGNDWSLKISDLEACIKQIDLENQKNPPDCIEALALRSYRYTQLEQARLTC